MGIDCCAAAKIDVPDSKKSYNTAMKPNFAQKFYRRYMVINGSSKNYCIQLNDEDFEILVNLQKEG